ncbi:protein serine/threonine phosphatase 2C [Clavulina sp. PMI_390]|nr:protein serine/threonine phosphatase 2C [Clavulina sp. PMI_390]
MPLTGPRLQTDMGWPGEGPFWYTAVPEPELSEQLVRASHAKSVSLSRDLRIDSVTIQPCLEEKEASQDRLFSLEVPGVGTLTGVFDGHGGHEVADLAVSTLPNMLSEALTTLFSNGTPSPDQVSSTLAETILSLDNQIIKGVTSLFPGGINSTSALDVDKIVSENHEKILLGMRGTTVLIALVDEAKENLWVANLGDCVAVMVTEDPATGNWTSEALTTGHNGNVSSEADRIRAEHPGEPDCMARGRVLGAIAVTRALGDLTFKLPAPYTSRVFLSPKAPPFRTHTSIQDVVLPRIFTAPYMNANADVKHHSLSRSQPGAGRRLLILTTDGLPTVAIQANDARLGKRTTLEEELNELERRAMNAWGSVAGRALVGEAGTGNGNGNVALAVLRAVIGSDDGMGNTKAVEAEAAAGRPEDLVLARALTVEMQERWMDDSTVQAVHL